MKIITLPIRFKCGDCGKIKTEARFPCADEVRNRQAWKDFEKGKVYQTGFLCYECQKKMGIKNYPILSLNETI